MAEFQELQGQMGYWQASFGITSCLVMCLWLLTYFVSRPLYCSVFCLITCFSFALMVAPYILARVYPSFVKSLFNVTFCYVYPCRVFCFTCAFTFLCVRVLFIFVSSYVCVQVKKPRTVYPANESDSWRSSQKRDTEILNHHRNGKSHLYFWRTPLRFLQLLRTLPIGQWMSFRKFIQQHEIHLLSHEKDNNWAQYCAALNPAFSSEK